MPGSLLALGLTLSTSSAKHVKVKSCVHVLLCEDWPHVVFVGKSCDFSASKISTFLGVRRIVFDVADFSGEEKEEAFAFPIVPIQLMRRFACE